MHKKILLVDDDPLVLRSVAIILRRNNLEVTCAASMDEAIKLIEDNTFDLVISDIRMPGLNGVAGAGIISSTYAKKNPKGIPIIFITGYAGLDGELKAEKLGEVLYKPFDVERLVMTIREYL